MKFLLYRLAALLMLVSCSASKDYLSRNDDKTLYDIVKKLNKHSDDEEATKALAEVYKQAEQRHLSKIAAYERSAEMSRWDKLKNEYNILQNMYEAITGSDPASRLVTPKDYRAQIATIKESAAEDYYQLGEHLLDNNNKEDAKGAYQAFKKSNGWIKDYKDTRTKMDVAYNNSIVVVVINPIQDNSFFFNIGWGNMGYNYSNEYFQQNLVRDLGGIYASRYPARFYTDWEARRENVEPDWVVDLTLRNIDVPRPSRSNYSRSRTKQIQVGTDTSGKPVYKTITANVNIQRQFFTARAQMDLNIQNIRTHQNIGYNTYSDTYHWQEETATYSGDKRALTDDDWSLINNDNYRLPEKEDILNRLYGNIYPQIRSRISNEVDW